MAVESKKKDLLILTKSIFQPPNGRHPDLKSDYFLPNGSLIFIASEIYTLVISMKWAIFRCFTALEHSFYSKFQPQEAAMAVAVHPRQGPSNKEKEPLRRSPRCQPARDLRNLARSQRSFSKEKLKKMQLTNIFIYVLYPHY